MTLMSAPNAYDALAIKEATSKDYMEIWQKGPSAWQNSLGEFHYEDWIFRSDVSHSGLIWTTPDVVAKYGFTDDTVFEEGDLDFFHIRNDWKGEWNEGADPARYPDEYAEELAEFKTMRFCHISHCFYVKDPDGNVLGYGDETPFGIIGSKEFTCWWNGFPYAMLAECNIDSWCDG